MSIISVIGKNSNTARFLRKELVLQRTGDTWRFYSHGEVDENVDSIRQSDVVLNLAVHPRVMTEGLLTDETNLDMKLARLIQGTDAHYLMASSRKVYGDNPKGVTVKEETPVLPEDPYGRAKAQVEVLLSQVIPQNRLSIVRFTNIVGFNDWNQQGLIGAVFRRFANGQPVTIDLDPDCPRDFLPQKEFARSLIAFVQNPQAGTYNLGTGVGIALKEIVDGWASVFDSTASYVPKRRETGFVLETSKLLRVTGLPALEKDCVFSGLMEEAGSARRHAQAWTHELIT